jgi:hypothetical protein
MNCPDRPHVHESPTPVLVRRCWTVDLDNGASPPVALCIDQTVAERIAVLIDRHGLVDVPDTPAAAVCPWPPPAHPSFGVRRDDGS